MSKRITPEEVIVNYFTTEQPLKVEVMFNIVKGIAKSRVPGLVGRKATSTNVKSKRASKTTEFNPQAMEQ